MIAEGRFVFREGRPPQVIPFEAAVVGLAGTRNVVGQDLRHARRVALLPAHLRQPQVRDVETVFGEPALLLGFDAALFGHLALVFGVQPAKLRGIPFLIRSETLEDFRFAQLFNAPKRDGRGDRDAEQDQHQQRRHAGQGRTALDPFPGPFAAGHRAG